MKILIGYDSNNTINVDTHNGLNELSLSDFTETIIDNSQTIETKYNQVYLLYGNTQYQYTVTLDVRLDTYDIIKTYDSRMSGQATYVKITNVNNDVLLDAMCYMSITNTSIREVHAQNGVKDDIVTVTLSINTIIYD